MGDLLNKVLLAKLYNLLNEPSLIARLFLSSLHLSIIYPIIQLQKLVSNHLNVFLLTLMTQKKDYYDCRNRFIFVTAIDFF